MHAAGNGQGRRLRAVGEDATPGVHDVLETIEAAVGETPEGIAPPALRAAVAERLGVGVEHVARRDLDTALGLLIAGGRIDEAGGRLVAVVQEERRAI
ncbi:MAG: hypothetical protein AB7V42_01475 [Thermoleophilia bacterium]